MKPRLLVTDPDPVLLLIYQGYFSKFGFDVATAANGPECLAQLRKFSPDILVLSRELRRGGADGVLSIMREESEMRPIPVVLTVDDTSRLNAAELHVRPVINLLAQPFHLHDLRSTVEAAVSMLPAS